MRGLSKWSGAQPVDWTRVPPSTAADERLGRAAYVAAALRLARAADPGALLMVNEFNVHGDGTKSRLLVALCEGLLRAGAPLGGVGLQLHLSDAYELYDEGRFAAQMARIAALGLRIHVTELDINPTAASYYGNATEAQQLLDVLSLIHI